MSPTRGTIGGGRCPQRPLDMQRAARPQEIFS